MSSLRDRIDAARKAIADNKASFEKAYKWKVGKTIVRILPGITDPDDFDKDVGQHYIKHPVTDAIIAVVGDAESCYGKMCPVRQAIGETIQHYLEMGDEATATKVKKWLARRNHVVNMEILGGVDTENKGKVLRVEFSDSFYDEVMSAMQTMLEADPAWTMKDGIVLVVERVGTGQTDTRYTVTLYPKELPAPTKAILDQRIDLQSYVDGKFGTSVQRALAALSTFLGRDVTEAALGSALSSTVTQIAAPAATQTAATSVDPIDADFDDLLNDVTPTPAPAAKAAAPAPAQAAVVEDGNFDNILAELEGL